MDTKSKSFKYSFAVKTLCVFLSLIFAFGSAMCFILSLGTVLFCGSFDCFNSEWTLEQTGAYNKVLYDYTMKMSALANSDNQRELAVKFDALRERTVDAVLEDFFKEKAKLIEKQLKWYYDNETISEDLSIYITGLQELKKILDTTEGTDFLAYENYVRDSLYYEDYEIDMSVTIDGEKYNDPTNNYIPYSYNDSEAQDIVDDTYTELTSRYVSDGTSEEYKQILGELRNLNYYVKTPAGAVFSNMSDPENGLKTLKQNKQYILYSDGKMSQKGLTYCLEGSNRSKFYTYIGLDTVSQWLPKTSVVAFYISENTTYGDVFYRLSKGFEMFGAQHTLLYVVLAMVLLLCAVISLLILLFLSGHRADTGEIKIALIDKMPTDLHLLLSVALVGGLITCAVLLCVYGLGGFDISYGEAIIGDFLYSLPVVLASSALCALSWLAFIEWISSTVRLKKSGMSFLRRFLGVQFLCWVGRLIKRIFSLLFYKPKKFKRNVAFICISVLLIEFFLIVITVGVNDEMFKLAFIALFVIFNVIMLIRLLHYVETLDEVIYASEDRRVPKVNFNSLPVSLKSLVKSMSITQSELDRAIDTAVKDERMKTELITNVSHDLKTPLTSIISYVDLLKRCNITDETALSYLTVLEEKSARLKTLVEDLVEASKASSGNVTLNKTGLNLTELVLQATGEMGGDFENRGLELIFDEPANSPIVFADGQKTYRVIENLFNNARKYSADNSRVYVSITCDNSYGYMEIKNISRQMLNISPDELTERFVRGDSSRTDGGSGLGLAIAKDLCELQNGMLKLEIDGDLFKATVCLPIYHAE